MKVKTKGGTASFSAFDLVIRIESQDEFDELRHIFNHSGVCESMPSIDADAIREAMKKHASVSMSFGEFCDKLQGNMRRYDRP